MAMGRPIITTNAPGCRETVIDGVTGFLVPVQDITLVEKIEWFIKNQDEIMRMGQASYQFCRDKFDV
jgi:glycosyltransferase involved in cell wall biosynthesis